MPSTAQQYGRPCWSKDQITKVISQTAQTSAASAASFLAAHSPFQRITDCKAAGHTLSEEEVFSDIFNSRSQVQAFVKGQPGTGKSHLIRWIKERSDYAARDEKGSFKGEKIVLVTRGNGSLKDALRQIVDQLGQEFKHHINRVQGAIDRLSDETARAMLLSELALEVDTRWSNEHQRASLPKKLQNLGQALRANGFGEWMKRDGSVIHSVIQRLADSSSVEERETFPTFTPSDFEVPQPYLHFNTNSRDVLGFADDLAEESNTRELAAQVLNTALQDAIRAMTGLKGDDLLTIFTEIRRQLGPDRVLVVLIEDVSVTGLDQDVINAFEPRDSEGLCRMVAVLGITENGWIRLPDNVKQRATHVYEVGGSTVKQWASNPEEIAKFTARYLNAIRSSDEELKVIANERFQGDVRHSHCTNCECRTECHDTFGKIEFEDGAEVGMFPFTKQAPYALLQGIVDAQGNTDTRYKSQRGLLDHILLSALDRSYDNLQNERFPRSEIFPVNPPPSTIWAGFENRYCGSGAWDNEQKLRLKFLALLWVTASNTEELATKTQPLLKPFGLPSFSSKPPTEKPPTDVIPQVVTPPPTVPLVDSELNRLINLLDTWISGQPLKEDSKFRDLLGSLLSKSIVWEDQQEVPIKEKKRLVSGNTIPRIEGQVSNPRGTYNVYFSRDHETYELLRGLLMLSRSANKTWNFDSAELHKRKVSRWLRKHQEQVIKSVKPEPPSIAEDSRRAAVQALALTALLRDRKKLPDERGDRINSIFIECWPSVESPVVLSKALEDVVADLGSKNADLRSFLVKELGAGQGDADPRDFINPVPILRDLADFEKRFQFSPPPAEAASSYWEPRFTPVKAFTGSFASYQAALEKEQHALGEAVNTVRNFVEEAGFAVEDLRSDFEKCLSELASVIEFQRKPGILPFGDEKFDELWKKKYLQTAEVRSSWGANVINSLELSQSENLSEVATFKSAKIKECKISLEIVKKYLERVDQELQIQENEVVPEGDSRSLLLNVLDEIANILDTEEQGETNDQ